MQLTTSRLAWVDVVRLLAIFMVICCHCCDPFNCAPEARSNPLYTYWGSLYGSFLRPCVPLFAMLTGLLVLPIRQMTVGQFYKHRLLRVLVPFLLWSVLYNLFPFIVGLCGGDAQLVTTFFPYAGLEHVPDLSWADTWHRLLLIPFNFSVYDVHMWYIYMLLGLYLFMPILSAWLAQATQRDLQVFLSLWSVTLFFPYVIQYVAPYFWGTCSWNSFGMLYYFAGFNGYVVLGYYLRNYNQLSRSKSWLLAIPLFVLGYVITLIGFRSNIQNPAATEEMIELFWTYCSPNVVLMTIACFLVLQRVEVHSVVWRQRLSCVGRYGYGIYMCHYFFVGVAYLFVTAWNVPVALQIPVTALMVALLSWSFTASLYRFLPARAARMIMG